MNIDKFFSKILEISAPWYIKSVTVINNKIVIEVDFKRGSIFEDNDPDSKICKSYKVFSTVVKEWRHLDIMQYECYIKARTPKIKRDDGRVRLINPPWAGIINGFTLLLESYIIKLSREMTVHKIAKLINTYDNKIWNMLDIYTNGAKMDNDYNAIDVVGIDETSVARGHQYITLFVDLKTKRTIFISEGKSNKTIVNFAKDLKEHNANSNQIKEVSCDMSPAFVKGVKENLPNAQITFDKFHIAKIINEAVNKVRKQEVKKHSILKNSKYVLLKNKSNLNKKQKEKMKELSISKLNLKSMKALQMRENYQEIYKSKTSKEFQNNLKNWYYWLTHSKLKPMIKVAKTIKKHWDGIIRWKESQINNGILEGLNSILQAAKRKARGYKAKHFITMAYLLTGKLDFSKVNKYCVTSSFL
jgi:transposase